MCAMPRVNIKASPSFEAVFEIFYPSVVKVLLLTQNVSVEILKLSFSPSNIFLLVINIDSI